MLRSVVRSLNVAIGIEDYENRNSQLNGNRKRLNQIVLVIGCDQVASETPEIRPQT